MSAAPSSPPGAPPGAALTLWLVRHGATAWNEGGQWQGWTDTPLGDLGREQALGLGPVLAAQPFGAAYTSDLRRARQTAELALSGGGLKCDLRTDPRLRELHLGDYEGLTLAQMQAHAAFAPWQADPWTQPVPGGESLQVLAGRLRAWLGEVEAQHSGERVIAFSHSIAIRTLMRDLLGLPLVAQDHSPIPYAERLGNGQFAVLEQRDGVWRRVAAPA